MQILQKLSVIQVKASSESSIGYQQLRQTHRIHGKMIILRCYPGILVQSIRDYVSAGISVRASVGVTRNLSSKHIMENFVNIGKQFLNQGGQGAPQGEQQSHGFNMMDAVTHGMQHNEQQGGGNQQQMLGQVVGFLNQKHQSGQMDEHVNEGGLMDSFKKIAQQGQGSDEEHGQAAACVYD